MWYAVGVWSAQAGRSFVSFLSPFSCEEVADDAVVRHAEDGGVRVVVDGDDGLRASDAGGVLDGAGDAAGDVQSRPDGLAGLADLVRVGQPARVDERAGAADGGAEGVREVADDLEPFRGTDTAAAGDDDLRAFEVDGLIADLVDDFDDLRADIFLRHMDVFPDDGRMAFDGLALAEHAGTDRAHLGPVLRTLDLRHQVAADGGTGPEDVAGLFIDVELGAVRGQAGPEPAGDTGAEVPPVGRGADEDAGGRVFRDEFDQCGGVGIGRVVLKFGAFRDDDAVGSVFVDLFDGGGDFFAEDDRDEVAALLVRHHAAGGQQFDADVPGAAVGVRFDEHPEVFGPDFHCVRLLIPMRLCRAARRAASPRTHICILSDGTGHRSS